jgi:hypothetical protein
MKLIASHETELTGNWFSDHGTIVADETCQRIAQLTKEYLVELCHDPSGWDILYRDPNDCRFWELIYPQSELQSGGPPKLRWLSEEKVKSKYGGAVVF